MQQASYKDQSPQQPAVLMNMHSGWNPTVASVLCSTLHRVGAIPPHQDEQTYLRNKSS